MDDIGWVNVSNKDCSTKEIPQRQKTNVRGAQVSQPHHSRRQPTQERSRFTVASILQAAAELIAAEGFDRASTNRIARRAGVSIGSLYQYFPNKEAILGALLEKHHREVHDVVHRAVLQLEEAAVPLGEGLTALFSELHDLHREHPELTRVLSSEVPSLPRGPQDHDFGPRVTTLLASRSEVTVADPRIAAILLGQTVEALTKWLSYSAAPDLDYKVFIDESVRMLVGYLTGFPPSVK